MSVEIEGAVIHPSMKTVWLAWIFGFLVVIAVMWAIYRFGADAPHWIYALPLIALLPPLKMHLGRRLITLRLHNDHLTLETGFLSRTRRTVDMAKIQDVTVSQSLGQRLLNTGDLTLESAGERGAMGIRNLDRPRVIADAILNSSKQGRALL
jgi:uncharacterized membrane protein YdbT with pleckstrin-like domain